MSIPQPLPDPELPERPIDVPQDPIPIDSPGPNQPEEDPGRSEPPLRLPREDPDSEATPQLRRI